jgi:hypothetical protein
MKNQATLATFADFCQFYLSEHANRVSRRLHFIGSSIALALLAAALVTPLRWLSAVAVAQGYACARAGHFFDEKNRPATFRHPGFSCIANWRLWRDIATRKLPL